jgi:hypothetical protein
MTMPIHASRNLRVVFVAAAIFGAAAVAARPATAGAAGPPAGYARIWIYRVFDPSVTLRTPAIRFNGAAIGAARPGSAFYRDVPPGTYLVTADSQGSAPDQFARFALAGGETAFVRVDADNWWASANCNTAVITFYTRVVGLPLAAADMAGLPVSGGG